MVGGGGVAVGCEFETEERKEGRKEASKQGRGRTEDLCFIRREKAKERRKDWKCNFELWNRKKTPRLRTTKEAQA